MPGPRRRNGHSNSYPLAAEVLETRALLSGAAAVHAAAHHTATVSDKTVIRQAAQVTGGADFSADHNGSALVPGHFTTLKPGHSDGDNVSFKFQGVIPGHTTITLKMSFAGKVTNVSGPSGNETFTVNPTAGSLHLTIKEKGDGTAKIGATIDPAPFTYVDQSGAVSSIHVVFNESPHNKPPYTSGNVTVNMAIP